MSDSGVGVSFSGDILPLFRPTDVEHMKVFGVFLHKYEWMSQASNALNVYRPLTGQLQPQMPLGGPFWTKQKVDLLKRWIDEGCRP